MNNCVSAFASEVQRDGAPEALGCAGDKYDFSI
jgi:hypothetical protein